jgi:hypothetical protein
MSWNEEAFRNSRYDLECPTVDIDHGRMRTWAKLISGMSSINAESDANTATIVGLRYLVSRPLLMSKQRSVFESCRLAPTFLYRKGFPVAFNHFCSPPQKSTVIRTRCKTNWFVSAISLVPFLACSAPPQIFQPIVRFLGPLGPCQVFRSRYVPITNAIDHTAKTFRRAVDVPVVDKYSGSDGGCGM